MLEPREGQWAFSRRRSIRANMAALDANRSWVLPVIIVPLPMVGVAARFGFEPKSKEKPTRPRGVSVPELLNFLASSLPCACESDLSISCRIWVHAKRRNCTKLFGFRPNTSQYMTADGHDRPALGAILLQRSRPISTWRSWGEPAILTRRWPPHQPGRVVRDAAAARQVNIPRQSRGL